MNLAWPVATLAFRKGFPHNRRGSDQNVHSTDDAPERDVHCARAIVRRGGVCSDTCLEANDTRAVVLRRK